MKKCEKKRLEKESEIGKKKDLKSIKNKKKNKLIQKPFPICILKAILS